MNDLVQRCRALVARVPRPAVRAAGAVLAALTALFVVLEVVRQWDDLVEVVRAANPWWLVAAAAVFAIGEAGYALVWPATLRRTGHPVPVGTASATFLVTQTAKFVPGSVWQHVGRVGTGDRIGVPKRVIAGALVLEVAASVAAALFLAALVGTAAPLVFDTAGPGLRALELGAGIAAVVLVPEAARRAAGRVGGRSLIAPGPYALVVGWHVVVWALYGAGAGLLSVGLGGPFIDTVGAFCLSWVVGLVVVGAPAGLGVREAVMVAALTPVAGADVALAVTIGSRAVWTVVQFAGAALGLGYLSRDRRRSGPDVEVRSGADDPDRPSDVEPPAVPC